MASLTPGVLSKLLQNLHNPTAKVNGDHRSVLLQVIGIVPHDDVFDFDRKKTGFYLRVSDSVHSAYVSVPETDVDLILSDKIQLGQFVYVTRFDSSSPVPVLRGIKPVLRRRPCVGEPVDLISSELLVIKGKSMSNRVGFFSKKEGKGKEGNARRLSLANRPVRGEPEPRRLSLDYSSRKAWDRSGSESNTGSGTKPKEPSSPLCSTPVRSIRKASSVKDLAPLKNKNVIVSEKLISKPIKKDLKSPFDPTPIPSHLKKVPIGVKTWSDSKISWDFVSPSIRELGKEAICCRNVGFSSAVQALEETSAMENILQCTSVFAEICKLAETSSDPLVERFLNFYQKIQESAAIVNALMDSKSTRPKNGTLWVQAALETNLSNFTLFTKEDDKSRTERNYLIVLENGPEKAQSENRKSPRTPNAAVSKARRAGPATKKEIDERVEWSKENGLKESANLAERLMSVSRRWFLDYLEECLKNGFGSAKGDVGSGVVMGLLGQLKRVNRWLDGSIRGDERVESLRKKLYGFLLDHVQKTGL